MNAGELHDGATQPEDIDERRMRRLLPLMARRPLISVIVPAYDTQEPHLRAAVDSVRAQVYPDWELCIADDGSSDPRVRDILAEYAALDSRIKLTFRDTNGHISRATNSALALATGEFVAFLDHDDELTRDALFECALLANHHPDVDMMYSDEDKIDEAGARCNPSFKPGWNPDTFLSRMYTGHLCVYRRALVESLGGLRPEFDGAQDYDLVLRLTERTQRIHHIPKILYHWRMHPVSTASDPAAKPYVQDAAERALGEAIRRRGEPGRVGASSEAPWTYIVRYSIRDRKRVSVIVPAHRRGQDVARCVESILTKTTYDDFEIVLTGRASMEIPVLRGFAGREARLRYVRCDAISGVAYITNRAVALGTGHYVVLLAENAEVVSADWMEAMIEQAQRPSIGAVGALFLDPDESGCHSGAVLGIGGAPGNASALRAVNNASAFAGACLMVRRSIYDRVGGLDEGIPTAFQDVDFCLRIRDAGYRNVYLPHVKLRHFEPESSFPAGALAYERLAIGTRGGSCGV